MLAKRYEAALLTVDGIILEAISNGNTPAGLRAREMCSEAGRRRVEEMKVGEGGEESGKAAAGGLSVEAVTAHTAGQGSVAHRLVWRYSVHTVYAAWNNNCHDKCENERLLRAEANTVHGLTSCTAIQNHVIAAYISRFYLDSLINLTY